mmetsp:Transcript_54475/g.151831  ORF Transcript_54475/g.151831 Transcript_54475/m.151831 type:complete len:212 (-) Transcript_54475:111-746(-)|eukprot:CAMPEP_0117522162 /NCGR_PEP_ID=MMETSP0784-20121206/34064_1 /TAXON_ID=39447 /ORGANISM="" /LENGTH=211 /DNA_ID=CAMNT_0005318223 /DNA_START=34 /DNA_END=669 /DNA_ORIENTATION=-
MTTGVGEASLETATQRPGGPQAGTRIVKCEHKPGHRPFSSYKLPSWVQHPDAQKKVMYLHPEDYMGTKRSGNFHGWNIAHVGAQCAMYGGQGFRMLEKATVEEINAQDLVEGFTPLHWAVLSDNPKAVIWLLKNGADRNAEDYAGRKAEDLIEHHWGEFHQRYWEYLGPKREHADDPSKVLQKRTKQMKDAFSLVWSENEFDIEGYKLIQV